MNWNTLLERYRRHRADLRATTWRIKERWLRKFAHFCQARGLEEPGAVTSSTIHAFQQRLTWEPGDTGTLYSPNTIDQAMRVLRTFFRWASRERQLLVDPTEGLVLPRVPRKLYRILTESQTRRLLSMPPRHHAAGLRDRLLLEILYSTGVRRQECVELDLEDVDLASEVLTVREGKSGFSRQLPIGKRLGQALSRYLEASRPVFGPSPEEPALLVSPQGKRVSCHWVGRTVRRYGRQAGIPFPVTPHSLRHAFATHLLEGKADLREIQELLGHKRLSSTQIYAHLCPAELKAEHRRTHPRSRRRSRRSFSS